jgi:hypothetical protein
MAVVVAHGACVFVQVSRLEDERVEGAQIEAKFPLESVHPCRYMHARGKGVPAPLLNSESRLLLSLPRARSVMGFNAVDGSASVSLQPSVLSQLVLRAEELKPGMLVKVRARARSQGDALCCAAGGTAERAWRVRARWSGRYRGWRKRVFAGRECKKAMYAGGRGGNGWLVSAAELYRHSPSPLCAWCVRVRALVRARRARCRR